MTDLYDRWQADAGRGRKNKDRPAWVRANRDDLAGAIDTDEPLPGPDASLAAFAGWLDRFKGTVTRQLNPDVDEDGETPTTDATEGDA